MPKPAPARTSREQLITHATRIFAAKGYAAASTREICEAAGANVAAIHYHFGDKEGLYRAVLERPVEAMTSAFHGFDDPALAFEEAMSRLLAPFIGPARGGPELDAHTLRLHLREMMEPSPAFREITRKTIVPVHAALTRLLARHAGLTKPDADIHQLALAMVAMANDYCRSRNFLKLLAPEVLEQPNALAHILDRLVAYCRALLDAEVARRRATKSGGVKRAA